MTGGRIGIMKGRPCGGAPAGVMGNGVVTIAGAMTLILKVAVPETIKQKTKNKVNLKTWNDRSFHCIYSSHPSLLYFQQLFSCCDVCEFQHLLCHHRFIDIY